MKLKQDNKVIRYKDRPLGTDGQYETLTRSEWVMAVSAICAAVSLGSDSSPLEVKVDEIRGWRDAIKEALR